LDFRAAVRYTFLKTSFHFEKAGLMGELDEPRWAVISERGCEASSLSYDEARKLLRRLVSEKVHGTCIITNEAARNLAPVKPKPRTKTRTSPQPTKTHSKA
jgi:hypothetical protein